MFRYAIIFGRVVLSILASSVYCMECDYKFLNKRAKAYATAVVKGESIQKESVIDDLHCMNVKLDVIPDESHILELLNSFWLPQDVSNFCDDWMKNIYKKLEDQTEKGRFLLLLGGIVSEILMNVDSASIISGAID